MFTKAERLISLRNLRPKKKEGFLKIISIFSFLGIMLGVAILIIVMSVMNGFKTDLTNKILGLNPHVVIQPNSFKIDEDFIINLKKNFKEISLSKSYTGEGITISNNNAKGVILKGVDKKEKNIQNFFNNYLSQGNLSNLNTNRVFIGSELAFNLDLKVGDKLSLMSSAFVSTPLGSLPKQENFIIAGIFTTGFLDYDKNIVFLRIEDALSIFDKEKNVSMLNEEYTYIRSQDLQETFHDAGQFYWGTVNSWLNSKNALIGGLPFFIPRWRVQDIDNMEDWKRVEILHKLIEDKVI